MGFLENIREKMWGLVRERNTRHAYTIRTIFRGLARSLLSETTN